MVAMVPMDLVCDLRSMNNGSISCRSSIAVGGSRDSKLEQIDHTIILVLVMGGRDYIIPKRRQGLYLVYKRYILPIG